MSLSFPSFFLLLFHLCRHNPENKDEKSVQNKAKNTKMMPEINNERKNLTIIIMKIMTIIAVLAHIS